MNVTKIAITKCPPRSQRGSSEPSPPGNNQKSLSKYKKEEKKIVERFDSDAQRRGPKNLRTSSVFRVGRLNFKANEAEPKNPRTTPSNCLRNNTKTQIRYKQTFSFFFFRMFVLTETLNASLRGWIEICLCTRWENIGVILEKYGYFFLFSFSVWITKLFAFYLHWMSVLISTSSTSQSTWKSSESKLIVELFNFTLVTKFRSSADQILKPAIKFQLSWPISLPLPSNPIDFTFEFIATTLTFNRSNLQSEFQLVSFGSSQLELSDSSKLLNHLLMNTKQLNLVQSSWIWFTSCLFIEWLRREDSFTASSIRIGMRSFQLVPFLFNELYETRLIESTVKLNW